MKEELLRVLSIKLDDININIDSLTDLNKKISIADDNLDYIKKMLEKFKDDGKYNVLNLTRFSSDEFSDILSLVRNDVSDVFKTKNCNYDGLVYLINGINNGVSLSLTIEQENAINYLISGMEELMRNDMAIVDGLNLVKTRFEIDDVNVLENKKRNFVKIIDKLNNDKYVDEVEDVCEAMEFNKLDTSNMNDILVYLLKYNADIYDKGDINHYEDEMPGTIDTPQEEVTFDEPEYHEEIQNSEVDNNIDETTDNENDIEFHLPEFSKIDDDHDFVVPTNYDVPFMPDVETSENDMEDINITVPNSVEFDKDDEEQVSADYDEEENTDVSDDKNIDADFNDIVPQDDYEEYKTLDETVSLSPVTNDKTSTREVQRLFQEYNIGVEDSELNQYLDGNIDEYEKIIKVFKDNGILNKIVDNKNLFREIIVNSHENEIINVLDIIKNDLSVDNEDYETTLNIAINTIPSIFVGTGGNYDNFTENVKLFKDLGINLVSLFDFSKEVLVANHENVLENYNIVKKYDINIDYKNAKYFLLLDNIASRMDYYVESVYEDNIKKETFDGYKYIKDYPNKLNVVTDETIKRLRYSSEKGRKVFGSKPNSLTGEITNLKVNVLDIPTDYFNNFFDNKFDDITEDEMRQYIKLCNNSSNVGDYYDELSMLEKYRDNIRYNINGIKVSSNKVERCYNTLRSYGIDNKKALEFAVCYNLIITNDEYHNLKKVLLEGVDE